MEKRVYRKIFLKTHILGDFNENKVGVTEMQYRLYGKKILNKTKGRKVVEVQKENRIKEDDGTHIISINKENWHLNLYNKTLTQKMYFFKSQTA